MSITGLLEDSSFEKYTSSTLSSKLSFDWPGGKGTSNIIGGLHSLYPLVQDDALINNVCPSVVSP